ncbi:hypothetical protein jhhlp_007141 [Lomentospora prolificans]|uniref:ditrans,polycis-polyprenyl diphosphate synthase [(2E,6E)-farnesyldiphosphate specific] n=1 Tax=Lomentospora prolificans TaxID=41688 RepID=A0A2N3N1U5_9PEZI|nr:hypothetical protein jhhlp_007141 [Lomentospora prolificans]
MALRLRDRNLYRADEKENHRLLGDDERQRLLNDYMPPPPPPEKVSPAKTWEKKSTQPPRNSRLGVRRFLKNQLHLLIFALLHSIFSLYVKIRQTWNKVCYRISSIISYHHRTPELIENDVRALRQKPEHLSAILNMQEDGRATELERLVNEAADLAVWTACAGIPVLSIYERSGTLKRYLPQIHQAILQRFASYFGEHHPGLTVAAPHTEPVDSAPTGTFPEGKLNHLNVMFISYKDGRDAMVDLTKTLAEMSQKGKLNPADIHIDLIDAELSEGIMPEPDLLLLFSPHVELYGYPPWQVRLTEIFHLPDNQGVEYQVFIRGLRRYAAAQMRRGK